MYAIIRTGGHQEKVTVGEQITVDRLKQEPGEEVRFVPLMIAKDDGTIVTDHAQLNNEGAVVGKVLQHIKADKLDVFNDRQKTGYRKHTGHRQQMTLVEIAELRFGPVVERADEKRAAADLALRGLACCLLGILFPPLVLVGLVPLYYGGRKFLYASMGLGLIDDSDQSRA